MGTNLERPIGTKLAKKLEKEKSENEKKKQEKKDDKKEVIAQNKIIIELLEKGTLIDANIEMAKLYRDLGDTNMFRRSMETAQRHITSTTVASARRKLDECEDNDSFDDDSDGKYQSSADENEQAGNLKDDMSYESSSSIEILENTDEVLHNDKVVAPNNEEEEHKKAEEPQVEPENMLVYGLESETEIMNKESV